MIIGDICYRKTRLCTLTYDTIGIWSPLTPHLPHEVRPNNLRCFEGSFGLHLERGREGERGREREGERERERGRERERERGREREGGRGREREGERGREGGREGEGEYQKKRALRKGTMKGSHMNCMQQELYMYGIAETL